jgi:hypothetical protein
MFQDSHLWRLVVVVDMVSSDHPPSEATMIVDDSRTLVSPFLSRGRKLLYPQEVKRRSSELSSKNELTSSTSSTQQ